MTFEYKYIPPESQGLVKIKVSKDNHNAVFTYRKRTFFKSLFYKYEYFANDTKVRVECIPTSLCKILAVALFPVHLLLYGVSNYKEIVLDTKKIVNARKYGAFSSDIVTGELCNKLKGENKYA